MLSLVIGPCIELWKLRVLNWFCCCRKYGFLCALQLLHRVHVCVRVRACAQNGSLFVRLVSLSIASWQREGRKGWTDGWMEAGRQTGITRKAVTTGILSVLDKSLGTHITEQKHKLNRAGLGCFPGRRSIFSYRERACPFTCLFLWPRCETNQQLYIFTGRKAGFRKSHSCKG